MGWTNVFHCEIAEFPRQILKYHFPESISYDDITTTDFTIHRGSIDVITGGFPCQPFSLAGNRLGSDDPRYLWKEMCRAVREIQPTWVVGENVLGFTNWSDGLVFEQVQTDLENEGYEVQSYLLCAAGINAPHLRYRIFIVAHSKHGRNRGIPGGLSSKAKGKDKERQEQSSCREQIQLFDKSDFIRQSTSYPSSDGHKNGCKEATGSKQCSEERRMQQSTRMGRERDAAHPDGIGLRTQGDRLGDAELIDKIGKDRDWGDFPVEPPLRGGNDGISERLDSITFSKWRQESIKGYGNAVVPQLVYRIFDTIQQYENL